LGVQGVDLLLDRLISVAPMLDWTDRHERFFLRLLSRRVLLYTEMVTTGALIHGDRDRFLAFDAREHPVALQLGGSDPADLAACARMGEDRGYDEINLNLGCPSDRVQSGRFGACLMAEPALVARCVAAMREAVGVPVTVKTRIGIDHLDSFEFLSGFVRVVSENGCSTFIVHARKAWLRGLSPKANRNVPPLEYERVYRLKEALPDLEIVLNGGIRTEAQIREHLPHVDGVMIGRAAYEDPYFLATIDQAFYGETRAVPSRHEVLDGIVEYVSAQLADGVRLNQMTRHIMGLFRGVPGARAWRRHLSENAHLPGAGVEVIREAAALVKEQ
jgi:tRNA-dihydrouridine synthase A